jgi:hypothetical protein
LFIVLVTGNVFVKLRYGMSVSFTQKDHVKYVVTFVCSTGHLLFYYFPVLRVADLDPYVFVHSGSGSFYHKAEIVRKSLILTVL